MKAEKKCCSKVDLYVTEAFLSDKSTLSYKMPHAVYSLNTRQEISKWQGSSVTLPSISHHKNEQTQQAVSEHNAGTTRDQHFTSVSINSELGRLCLHHLRQMPHGINTGTLADCQMSQSHTNKPWGRFTKQSYGEQRWGLHVSTLPRCVYNTFWTEFWISRYKALLKSTLVHK